MRTNTCAAEWTRPLGWSMASPASTRAAPGVRYRTDGQTAARHPRRILTRDTGLTHFRMLGRVQQVGQDEFLAIVTAIPDNGDQAEIRTLSRLLASREEAKDIASHLLRQMRAIVVRIEGRISEVVTDGL